MEPSLLEQCEKAQDLRPFTGEDVSVGYLVSPLDVEDAKAPAGERH